MVVDLQGHFVGVELFEVVLVLDVGRRAAPAVIVDVAAVHFGIGFVAKLALVTHRVVRMGGVVGEVPGDDQLFT